jgi:hypothetical protein
MWLLAPPVRTDPRPRALIGPAGVQLVPYPEVLQPQAPVGPDDDGLDLAI